MNNLNEFDYQQLESLLNKLVENKVNEILNNLGVESSSFGRVEKINSTKEDEDGNVTEVVRASVKLSDGSIVENLYNASERILEVGDYVKIYGSKSDLTNRYIGIRYERGAAL